MIPENVLSGSKRELYIWEDSIVEPLPYFVYKVCTYKFWKNGFCDLGSKFFKSDRLINIKHSRKYNYYDNYYIEKTIELVGVPRELIQELNLQLL